MAFDKNGSFGTLDLGPDDDDEAPAQPKKQYRLNVPPGPSRSSASKLSGPASSEVRDEALDDVRHDFLQDLESSSCDLNDWEYEFVGSNVSRRHFSPGQRTVIDKLRKKFERHL